MAMDKSLITRNTALLVMKLLEQQDMYGYQMIEELALRSDDTFKLKAGTLYPLLHDLEKQGAISVYEKTAQGGRVRKYYSLTQQGRRMLAHKEQEWNLFSAAMNKVLKGGMAYGSV